MAERLTARKRDHIRICIDEDVEFKNKTTWLEWVELVHNPLPEIDLDEVSVEARFLGRTFGSPVMIEAMTGGTREAYRINMNLARAASELGIPLGLGSQRAALLEPSLAETYRVARDVAPDIFLIGNVGGVQLAKEGVELAEKAVEMVDADALAIHLNSLQERVQVGGEANFKGVLRAIERAVDRLSVPVIVKEVGCGISGSVAKKLESAGVKAIDVAGAGGTNWTLVEKIRAEEAGEIERARLAEVFQDWGIPTAASIIEVVSNVRIEVVSSGGIRTGLDVAKSLALGAAFTGIARPLLKPAMESEQAVLKHLRALIEELKTAMYLLGARSIPELKKVEKVLLGPLLEWCRQRLLI